MRTIKTYFKGAPFYIASASRNVAFALRSPEFPHDDNPVSQDLAVTTGFFKPTLLVSDVHWSNNY